MSASQVAEEIDFGGKQELEERTDGIVNVTPLVGGEVNCVRLTSLVELAPGVNWYSSDALMPPMIYPLTEPRVVESGRSVSIRYSCRFGGGLAGTAFHIE